MSKILSFYFTLRENTTKEMICNLVNTWLHTSSYYSFEETILSEDELESAVRSVKGENSSILSYCQVQDAGKHVKYLAFFLETRDSSNLCWRADVIFKESENANPGILIELSRKTNNSLHPSDCSQRIKYPSLVKLLFDANLVKMNSALGLNEVKYLDTLSEEDIKKIQSVFQKECRTDFPLLFLSLAPSALKKQTVFLQESLDESIQKLFQGNERGDCKYWKDEENLTRLLCIFSRVMHTYTLPRDTEHLDVNRKELLSIIGDRSNQESAPYLHLFYPWLNLEYHIDLDHFSDFKQLYDYLILLMQNCQQGKDSSFPDWYQIQDLISMGESNDPSKSYYLRMNQNVANAMQIRRKELHMTQLDLAEKIGTTKMLISRLERLQTIKVRRQMILQLEQALSLTPGSLENLAQKSIPAPQTQTVENVLSAGVEQPAFCHMCGKPLITEGRYCRWCGTRL